MKTTTTITSGMKYTRILSFPVLIFAVMTGCTIGGASEKTGSIALTVDNKDPLKHTDEQIVLSRSRLKSDQKPAVHRAEPAIPYPRFRQNETFTGYFRKLHPAPPVTRVFIFASGM